MPIYEEKDKVNGQKRYYIRTYITDEFGKRKQITKHNKEWLGRDGKIQAQQEEIRIKNKTKNYFDDVLFYDNIQVYLKELQETNKESTYYGHNSVINSQIKPFFNQNTKLFYITEQNIIKWHEWLAKQLLSLRYKKKCHMIMASILDIGMKHYGLQKNVARIVGNFKDDSVQKEAITKDEEKIKYITYEQFRQLINVINDEMWYVYFNLLYFTGMRKGEIQALTWNDIDFTNKRIIVNKTLTVKTKKAKWKITSTKNLRNRKIDMDDNLFDILSNYYNHKIKKQNINLTEFILGDTQPLKQHRIDTNKKKYFKLANIKEITNHEFRHSHVSFLANEYLKTNQTDVAKFFVMMSSRLGHSIKVMQDTYLHFFDDIQNEIVFLINNKNNKSF